METLAAISSTKTLTRISLPSPRCRPSTVRVASGGGGSAALRQMVEAFDPLVPLEEAWTPPSSWYTDPAFFELELQCVFSRGWQAVGYSGQINGSNNFFTGRLGTVEYLVCRDSDGSLHAFHNVCRHHASVLKCGSGQATCFECPYHGWKYGLNGQLLKATRTSGIKNFRRDDFSLSGIMATTWGPFVLINLDYNILAQQHNVDNVGDKWLGTASNYLSTNGVDESLVHVCRREYQVECNWKVFCDNYLDGGYHVPYAHKGLASGLNLPSYEILTFEHVSVQRCDCIPSKEDAFDRLGSKALYAYVYPNFMINRYGPWMDTNLVIPLNANRCKVVFDYFLDESLLDNEDFIHKSLEHSDIVQMEDVVLCEGIQRGLESPAYSKGRYMPSVESAMHHFHCLLHSSLSRM